MFLRGGEDAPIFAAMRWSSALSFRSPAIPSTPLPSPGTWPHFSPPSLRPRVPWRAPEGGGDRQTGWRSVKPPLTKFLPSPRKMAPAKLRGDLKKSALRGIVGWLLETGYSGAIPLSGSALYREM